MECEITLKSIHENSSYFESIYGNSNHFESIHRNSNYSRNRGFYIGFFDIKFFCLSVFLSLNLSKHCFICTNYNRKFSGFLSIVLLSSRL